MSRTLMWSLPCICLLGTLAWWIWARVPGGEPVHAPVAAAIRTPAASASPRLLAASRPAVASPAVRDARSELETTPDLFTYAQRLAARAHAGDADAGWLLSRVHDYCAGFARDPVGYASDTRAIAGLDVATAGPMVAARERVQQRCARFMPADGLSRQSIVDARLRAAQAGSLAAEAALLADGEPMSDAPDYLRDLVGRVAASRDPQAFLALSRAMGLAASGAEVELGQVSGSWLTELAWQIAACRLGLDCRPQGNLMTSYCAHGGICSRDPGQDFPSFVFDAGVPRQSADDLNEMVDSVLLSQGRTLK